VDHHASDVPPPREHRSALHRHIHWGGHNARSGWLGLANVSGSGIAPVGEAEKGVGQRFEREDGRAVLSIYARENQDDDTPAGYLRKNLRQPVLDYERVTRSFFAISMERDGTIYYSRCNFSARHSTIHCFDLVYPQSEKKAWDPVVTRISLSLRPLER